MAYATIAQWKEFADISSAAADALLTRLLAAAQVMLDNEIGETFEAAANASRYFDAVADVEGRMLWLDRVCVSINSVTNGDGETVSADDYVTEPRNDGPFHAITLKAGTGTSWTYSSSPENAITVSAKWAWTATAPADIVQATIRLADYLLEIGDAPVFDVTSIPEGGQMRVPKGTPSDVFAVIRYWRNRTRKIPR